MGEFEWDERKSEWTLRVRGFDFAYASRIFDGPTIENEDSRRDYGEQRMQVVGRIGTDILFVVYTSRDGIRRIISARYANEKERHGYRQVHG